MLELLPGLPAETLPLDRYRRDFQERFWRTDVSWKLERQPTFKEPGSPSWVAMARGDWAASMRLAEELRPSRAELQAKLDAHGIVQRRVRVVTRPLTDYLRWELHLLKIWSDLGEEITVVPAGRVRHLEPSHPLPEVLVLGDDGHERPVMYEILYERGELAGARRFEDPDLVARCRAEISALWHAGEALATYFAREVADLPPPLHATG
jgi:hypothetical protein